MCCLYERGGGIRLRKKQIGLEFGLAKNGYATTFRTTKAKFSNLASASNR